jgi:hypothetical protein
VNYFIQAQERGRLKVGKLLGAFPARQAPRSVRTKTPAVSPYSRGLSLTCWGTQQQPGWDSFRLGVSLKNMASNQGPCSQQPVSVVVANDHPVILVRIAGILQAQLDINVVAACSAGRAATAAIREFIPDVGRTDGSVGTRVRCSPNAHFAKLEALTAERSKSAAFLCTHAGATLRAARRFSRDLHLAIGRRGREFSRCRRGHRSISPNTMSSEPRIADTSASM